MRLAFMGTVTLLALTAVTSALAQDENTPEGMAVIKPGEVASLARDTIHDFRANQGLRGTYRLGRHRTEA